jgi:hypothetical protein
VAQGNGVYIVASSLGPESFTLMGNPTLNAQDYSFV